jgi:hypothetical protein
MLENILIIADKDDAPRRLGRIVFAIALTAGAAAALYYAWLGLTLTHYDARAHLVVARRVIDGLTPGWRQLGAFWLPLPHLLNLIPVQWDWSFRTGFSAVVLSLLAMSGGLAALGCYLARHVASRAVAVVVPLAVLANPNVLYLQSTPMTEALLFGLSFMALLAVDTWTARGRTRDAHWAGLVLAALVLTRYEGWLIGGLLVAGAWAVRPSPRTGWIWLAVYPVIGIAAFFWLSYWSSGVLLATSGFYTPNNPARGSWIASLGRVVAITNDIAGPAVMAIGAAGIAVALWRAKRTRGRSLLPLSLFATALLPLVAFHSGHPERVRYMVTIAVAAAACGGLAFAVVPARVAGVAVMALLGVSLVTRPPLSPRAPMVMEAQWEVPFSRDRRIVTNYLREHYDGTPIMASMGSLAHYMQETSAIGLAISNFLHEGNGDLWADAWLAPRYYVEWILIEERARDGGMLAVHAREQPSFLVGFGRVSEGGGLALYRRYP